MASGLEESHLPPARAAGAGRGAGAGAAQSGAPGGPQGGPRGASRWRGLGSWQVFMALQVMEDGFWLSWIVMFWFILICFGEPRLWIGVVSQKWIGYQCHNVTPGMIIASSQQLCLAWPRSWYAQVPAANDLQQESGTTKVAPRVSKIQGVGGFSWFWKIASYISSWELLGPFIEIFGEVYM